MSSQSVNTTTYSGYQVNPTGSSVAGAGTLYMSPIPTRDGSDYTRMIREQIRYNEFKTSNPISPSNTENPWIPYGNGFRLSYLQGKLKCAQCIPTTNNGNAFAGNGPYVNNVGGIAAS